MRENGSRKAYESHLRQQQMARTSAGVRQPWQGKRFAVSAKMELARKQRAQKDWRRNGGGGTNDCVPNPIPF
jgi:hypothetical protein